MTAPARSPDPRLAAPLGARPFDRGSPIRRAVAEPLVSTFCLRALVMESRRD